MANGLSIVIPTYNRADFLDCSLGMHLPLAESLGVSVFVSDNCSDDSTAEVVGKWMGRYENLFYHRNSENLGPDGNFEVALKLPGSDYVWLLGDTYCVTYDAMLAVVQALRLRKLDMLLINVDGEVRDVPARIYCDQNELLRDMFWLTTCLSVLVFSRDIISRANFLRYRETCFIQTCVIYEAVSCVPFVIEWRPDICVKRLERLESGVRKDLWLNRLFKVWFELRVNAIFSLPPSYSLENKLKAAFAVDPSRSGVGLASWISFRRRGFFCFSDCLKYRFLLGLVSGVSYFVVAAVSLCPVRFLEKMRFCRAFLLRKGGR